MALTRFFFASSLLLLSLLVIVSAGDYGYAPKSDVEKSKPVGDFGSTPKPDLNIPKPKEKEKLIPKSDLEKLKPTSDYGYDSKSDLEKPKLEKEKKLIPKPDFYQPKPQEIETELPYGCEGLVLCKSGSKYVPIKGAVARITCLAVDTEGSFETAPFSTYSSETDEKGYFFLPLSHLDLNNKLKLTACKAYLENSPLETCKVPTDVNKGISGACLSSYRILNDNNMKLYSVGPFFYSEEPKSAPTGY